MNEPEAMEIGGVQVLLERDGEGWFVATVPAMRGCHTQGQTAEEALERISEAMELWSEVEKGGEG